MKKTALIMLLITAIVVPSFSFAQTASSTNESSTTTEIKTVVIPEKTNVEKIYDSFTDHDIFITEKGKTIEITRVEKDKNKIIIFVKANKNDKPIGFGKKGNIETERIKIENPPVLIPDGTTHTVCNLHNDCYEIDNFMENPAMALRMLVEHTVELIGKENTEVKSGTIGHTTSIIYPSLNGIAYQITHNQSWATIYGNSGNANDYTSAEQETVGLSAENVANEYYYDIRAFYIFDTSSIGSGQTISNATFSAYGTYKNSGLGGGVEIVSATPASDSAIANSDYAIGNFGNTAYTTGVLYSALNSAGYQDFVFNATGISAINMTGITRFGIINSFDYNNTAPTWSSSAYSDWGTKWIAQAGTTQDPKLTITYEATTTGLCTSDICIKNLEFLYLFIVLGIFIVSFFLGKKLIS